MDWPWGRFLRRAGIFPSWRTGFVCGRSPSDPLLSAALLLAVDVESLQIDFLAHYSRFLPLVGWGGWICPLEWKNRAENLRNPIVFAIFKYYTLTLNVNLQSMSGVRLLGTSGLPFFRILWVWYMTWPQGHQAEKPLRRAGQPAFP